MRHNTGHTVIENSISHAAGRQAIKQVILVSFAALTIIAAGCRAVKPYQRVYLNDDNMQAGKQPVKTFTEHVHAYREGASGGGTGKSSGGCGCN